MSAQETALLHESRSHLRSHPGWRLGENTFASTWGRQPCPPWGGPRPPLASFITMAGIAAAVSGLAAIFGDIV
jgi:hypothetical protein